jgi:hypothetical protein
MVETISDTGDLNKSSNETTNKVAAKKTKTDKSQEAPSLIRYALNLIESGGDFTEGRAGENRNLSEREKARLIIKFMSHKANPA